MNDSQIVDRLFILLQKSRKISNTIASLIKEHVDLQPEKHALVQKFEYEKASQAKKREDEIRKEITEQILLLDKRFDFSEFRLNDKLIKEALSRFSAWSP